MFSQKKRCSDTVKMVFVTIKTLGNVGKKKNSYANRKCEEYIYYIYLQISKPTDLYLIHYTF